MAHLAVRSESKTNDPDELSKLASLAPGRLKWRCEDGRCGVRS